MKRVVILLCVAALVSLFATVAFASSTAAAPKEIHPGALADLHKANGITCADCHGKGKKIVLDDNEAKENKNCVQCHGTLQEIGEKSKEEINPHKSHLGKINCTACHSGHAVSKAYCENCHSFTLPMPGSKVTKAAPKAVKAVMKDEKTDVIVVGAGAAGHTAAINAFDAGAKVILIEKQPITGGNSMLAAGGMNAAETVFQKQKNIKDTVQLMYDDTMKGGQNINDPALVKILSEQSSSSVDWLTKVGADMSDVGRMGGASVNRTHRPTGGKVVGAHIIHTLRKNAEDRGIDVRVNSKVIGLVQDKSGKVVGVKVEGKHAGVYTIYAKAVVLTAGGFSANASKVAFYRPDYAGMTTSNQPGAQGEGMELGKSVGGELKDMNQIQIHPTVAAGSRILITEAVRGNGAILVNKEGKRFVNELTTRDKASAAILQQTGKSAYLIFDDSVRKSLSQIEGYFHLDLAVAADTPAALAAKIGVPAAALEETIAKYNSYVDAKKDADFGRADMPRAFRTAQYVAIEVRPGVHYTMGGLKINTETQVLSTEGKVIPGLYAAGEVTGGVHGANRLGGNSISETITFGRIAGNNAAKEALQK